MHRNFRILRLVGLGYRKPITELYQRNPALSQLTYAEQCDSFAVECYSYTDGFITGMQERGHEAVDIIYDCDELQRRWALEHGIAYNPAERELLILAQIAYYKPDVVYFQDVNSLRVDTRKYLKTLCPSVRLTMTHKGFPSPPAELRYVDVLLLGFPWLRDLYRESGFNAHLMYHGFNERVLQRLDQRYGPAPRQPRHPASFLGISGYSVQCHKTRYWFLAKVLQVPQVEAWLEESFAQTDSMLQTSEVFRSLAMLAPDSTPAGMVNIIREAAGIAPEMKSALVQLVDEFHARRSAVLNTTWNNDGNPPDNNLLPLGAVFPKQCREALFGLAMYEVLRASLVTLNNHTEAMPNSIGNLRMFQGTGTGACMLTDAGGNLSDLFEADTEVVTYSSPSECVEKLRYLLEHPALAREIGARGQQRTLSSHTIRQRCEIVEHFIQSSL